MKKTWFSSKIRFACFVEGRGSDLLYDSIFIFKSKCFDEAFNKALVIGHAQEKEYLNKDKKKVKWRLKEIISLDILKRKLDGAEVYSEPIELKEEDIIPFGQEFKPENSDPTQTI